MFNKDRELMTKNKTFKEMPIIILQPYLGTKILIVILRKEEISNTKWT